MLTLEKLKTLKELYQYRALDYLYIKDIKSIQINDESFMPNTIQELKNTVSACHLCSLSLNRTHVVYGEGNINAKIMFVGDSPGVSENITGKSFAGQAGQLLIKIIENVLLLRQEDVFITNIVKCRPSQNKIPTFDEISTCIPYLFKQIETIKPTIIVTLGEASFQYLTKEYKTPLTKVRGEILHLGNAKLIPTFHPSFLLQNPSAKKEVFQDMLKIKGLL